MKNISIFFALMLIANLALSQTFKDAESMVGHTVFFNDLPHSVDIFDVVKPEWLGKIKPLKQKDMYYYRELTEPSTLYKVESIFSDKKNDYLVLKTSEKKYYFKIGTVKGNASTGIYKYAKDYAYYDEKFNHLKNSYKYFDVVKFENEQNITLYEDDHDLFMGRYQKVDWIGMYIKTSSVDIVFAMGDAKFVYSKELLDYFMLPDNQLRLEIFNNRLELVYKKKYKHFDVTLLDIEEIENKPRLCKYFYPMQITRAIAGADGYTCMAEIKVDTFYYDIVDTTLLKSAIELDQIKKIQTFFDGLYNAKKKYKYIDIEYLKDKKISFGGDRVLYEKYYPISIVDTDLDIDNNCQYEVQIDTSFTRIGENYVDKYFATDEQLEKQRLIYEEQQKKIAFYNKYLKGYVFYRECSLSEFLSVNEEGAIIGMLYGVATQGAVTIMEGFGFTEEQCLYRLDAQVDSKRFDLSNPNTYRSYFEALDWAKHLKGESWEQYSISGNEVAINKKTYIYNYSNNTLRNGNVVYTRKKLPEVTE